MTSAVQTAGPASPAPAPDLAAVKARQQATWASGDFSAVATTIVVVAERLADAADLHAGWRVLDVATGSGNAAIAAARLGADVTGSDYVPALLERGRERAAAERLPVAFVEGDAEALPFGDSEFDAVLSVYGAMFAPDHGRAAGEIARVSRPGGRVALASWTPTGFLGAMFRTIAAHVPPPAGVASPMLWGTEDHLAAIFGDTVRWTHHRRRTYTFRFVSPEAFVEFFATFYGPTQKAFEALGERAHELHSDLAELAAKWNRLDSGAGAIAIPGEYLESIGERV
jgi:ubiquinone/menaquinone biosynthesis C-methylase UbiE